MDPKKIEVVRAINPRDINSLEKVRSFLGLCSYYRRFIKGFSHLAAPLTDLTRTGVDVAVVSQTPECQRAVQRLIELITSAPVLAAPRQDKEFIVKTDAASTLGIGGVLSQIDDHGHEHVVAYYGRRLTAAERHWSTTEVELLAALGGVPRYGFYGLKYRKRGRASS